MDQPKDFDFGAVFGAESDIEPPVEWADYDNGWADASPLWQKDRIKFWRAVARRNTRILKRLAAVAAKLNAQCRTARDNYAARMASRPRLEVEVRRIPLNAQGYTRHGQYFGRGEKLWRCETVGVDSPTITRHYRAADKATAKRLFTNVFPEYYPVWR